MLGSLSLYRFFRCLLHILFAENSNALRIQPYKENVRYWQYQGKPVMLLGASKTDLRVSAR